MMSLLERSSPTLPPQNALWDANGGPGPLLLTEAEESGLSRQGPRVAPTLHR